MQSIISRESSQLLCSEETFAKKIATYEKKKANNFILFFRFCFLLKPFFECRFVESCM